LSKYSAVILEFTSIEQPASVLPGEIFTVLVTATTEGGASWDRPYFGICLPVGWTIPGDTFVCMGVYQEAIVYDPNLSLEQEARSSAPEGYYWWVGDGNAVDTESGDIVAEVPIQTSLQTGRYFLDYLLGPVSYPQIEGDISVAGGLNATVGLNAANNLLDSQRSDNHLIDVINEYTPRELHASVQRRSVALRWLPPMISDEVTGYHVYRDGELIHTGSAQTTDISDQDLPGGVFRYSVSAIYGDGDEQLTPYEVKAMIFSGGTGDPNDPYLLETAEQLTALGDDPDQRSAEDPNLLDKAFVLVNDIDLDSNQWGTTTVKGALIPIFSGIFDGNDHIISNLSLAGRDNLGFIGCLESTAQVFNLSIVDANVTGSGTNVGTLAGSVAGDVTGCYASGIVSGPDSAGGLVGTLIPSGHLAFCTVQTAVNGDARVGGLVGYSEGTIEDSSADSLTFGVGVVGGLVGYQSSGIVSRCFSIGGVSGDHSVGGLAGVGGEIRNCYSQAQVDGREQVGGLIGRHHGWPTIVNCYAAGAVTGTTDVGGLIGANGYIAAYVSYWDVQTTGQLTSAGGVGRSTEQMQAAGNFLGWGCGSSWCIDEGDDYPRLIWEQTPGEVILPYTYGGGQGIKEDPYLINTAEQLNTIGLSLCDWSSHFKLMADLDMSDLGAASFNIIGGHWPFTGNFDGGDHSIHHFQSIQTEGHYGGLFGHIEGGRIEDVRLVEPTVEIGANGSAGALVGRLWSGTMEDCHVEGGSVKGDCTGGLVGQISGQSVLRGCSSSATVSGVESGGLVGCMNSEATINRSRVTASVTGTVRVGGLVGWGDGIITECWTDTDVTGGERVGGLLGSGRATIQRCYSTGTVRGNTRVGGLTGYGSYSEIGDCYSLADVAGDSLVGGLIGHQYKGSVRYCYSAGPVTGTSDTGGLIGNSHSAQISGSFWDVQASGQNTSDGGNAKTTDRMYSIETFLDAGWDFLGEKGNGLEDIWTILAGQDYPRLRWENAVTSPLLSDYLEGDGTPESPYLIDTPEDLNVVGLFSYTWTDHFRLQADLDLSGYAPDWFNVIGESGVRPFSGVFDGNGHVISNFKWHSTDREKIGLFGWVSHPEAVIKDLGMIAPQVDAGEKPYVGGLVGYLEEGMLLNCYVQNGDVAGDNMIGGLLGYSLHATVTGCFSTGTVTGDDYLGGLVGGNWDGSIDNCYTENTVIGDTYLGGLLGYNAHGEVKHCYSIGRVSGSGSLAGLIAYDQSSGDEVIASFWDIQTSGLSVSAAGEGKTTAEMQTVSTFLDAGWDFVGETENGTEDIWWIDEGQDYPRLWRELITEN